MTDAIKPRCRHGQVGEHQVLGFGNGDEFEALLSENLVALNRLDREPAITPEAMGRIFGVFGDVCVVDLIPDGFLNSE